VAEQKMHISYAKMNFTVSQPNICQRDSVVFFDSTECNVGIMGWGFKFDKADVPNQSDFPIGQMHPIKNYTPWPIAGKGSTVKFRQTNRYRVVLIDTCIFGCERTDTLEFDVHPRSFPDFLSSTDSITFNNSKDTVCINSGGFLYLRDNSYALPPFTNTKNDRWEWGLTRQKFPPFTNIIASDTVKDPTLQNTTTPLLYSLYLNITNEYGCTSDSVFEDQALFNEVIAQFKNPCDDPNSFGGICNNVLTLFEHSSGVSPQANNSTTRLKYEWDWGDGTPHTIRYGNVNRPRDGDGYHVYNLPNLVNKVAVKLTVTIVDAIGISKGCFAEYEDTVTVTRPIAKFTAEQHVFPCPQDEFGILGRSIKFSDESDGLIRTLKWHFGDTGITSTLSGSPSDSTYKHPTHGYIDAGKYDVILIATDENNCSDSAIYPSFVDIAGPRGSVSYSPTDTCAPINVQFTFHTPDATLYPNYVPDSIVINTSGAQTGSRVVGVGSFHPGFATYPAGEYYPYYTLYKTVFVNGKEELCAVRLSNEDTIFAVRIRTDFDTEPLYCPDNPVTFKNTTVITPPSNADAMWTFDNGDTVYTYNEATTQFVAPGKYNVTLKIDKGTSCSGNRSKIIEVLEFPTVDLSPDTADACDGLKVRFIADSLTDVDKSRIIQYEWIFDDASYVRGKDTNWLEREFTESGNYAYTLRMFFISDTAGCVQDYQDVINVNAFVSPVAHFVANPQHGQVEELFTFDANSSTQGDGIITKWVWDYDDNSGIDTLNTSTATHAYSISGERFVLLTIIDEYGCFDTIRERITVADEIYFGNIFTPDAVAADGGKSVFRPLTEKGTFAELKMEIYDKWGMRIWRNSCEDNSKEGTCPNYGDDDFWWDGTNSQGNPVTAGVYYWILYTRSSLEDGSPHVLNGSVTIFR
jgi:PKD repeat protein